MNRRDLVRRGSLWLLGAAVVDPLEAIERLTWRRKSFALGGLTPTVRAALWGYRNGDMQQLTEWQHVPNVPGGEFTFETARIPVGTLVQLRVRLPEELAPRWQGHHVFSISLPEGRDVITNGGRIIYQGQPLKITDA